MITKSHYFFLFNLSPWPLIISINLMSMFLSFSMFMKYGIFNNLFLSMNLIVLTSFLWWVTYSMELNLEGLSSLKIQNSIKFSMILFISSEILFFVSFFWSYFHFFLSPIPELSMSWPPKSIMMFIFDNIPLINTMVLLSSGLTITMSHYYLIENKMNKMIKFLMYTFILGFLFSLLQLKEYQSSFFSLNDSNFGSIFFMLTGFHGIHVLIGSLFIFTVFMRSSNMNCSSNDDTSFELAAWYWHFVDVIWIFLYFLIYYMNN